MRVPYDPNPTVRAEVNQPVSDQIRVDVPQFGQVGAALQGLGKTAEAGGDMLATHAVAFQGMQNETNAKEADIAMSQAISDRLFKFQMLEGKAKVDDYQNFQNDIHSIYTNTRAALPNDAARILFDGSAIKNMMYLTEGASREAAQANKQWMDQVATSRASDLVRRGVQSRNDPDLIRQLANASADEVASIAERNHEGPEIVKAKRDAQLGLYYTHVIDAKIADDPAGANELFQRIRGDLDGPAQETLAAHIRPHLEAREDADLVNRNVGVPGGVGGADAVWQRMIGRESGGKQFGPNGEPLTSSAGAIGRAQVMPQTGRKVAADLSIPFDETRFRIDPAYNEKLGRAYFDQMLQRYDGNTTLASAAYNAGPERVDEWIGKNGDPRTSAISDLDWASKIPIKETRDYASGVGAIGANNPPVGLPKQRIDKDAVWTRTMDAIKDLPPERQARIISLTNTRLSLLDHVNASEKRALTKHITDLEAAANNGVDISNLIPAAMDRVRNIWDQDEADRIGDNLELQQSAGQVKKGLLFGSPKDMQEALDDLHTGNGPISASMHGKLIPGAEDTGEPAIIQNAAKRIAIEKNLQAFAEQRQARLLDDPASYAAQSPLVAPLARVLASLPPNASPEDRQKAWGAYANATLSVQQHMGVAPEHQHVLSKDDAQREANRIMSADPGKVDIGREIMSLDEKYGDYRDQAWHDLGTLGRLPRSYETLGVIATQAGRREFQTMLQMQKDPAALKGMEDNLDSAKRDAINIRLAKVMPEFTDTAYVPNAGGDADMGARFTNDVKNLARFYVATEHSEGSDAVDKAYKTIISDHWDFTGNQRVPKDVGANAVETYEANLLANIKPADLKPSSDTMARGPEGGAAGPPLPGLTVPQRQIRSADFITGNGAQWVMNQSGNGAIFAGRDDVTKALVPLIRADGSRVEVLWKDIRAGTGSGATAPTQAAPDATQAGVEALP